MNRFKTIFRTCVLVMMTMGLVGCSQSPAGASQARDAHALYLQAMEALEVDSMVQARHLLHAAQDAALREADYHTRYLAQWQLAQAAMQSDPVTALGMAREALATYESHPDDERNHIILLDAVGTCAAQLAFDGQCSYDEALAYTRRAHRLALEASDTLGTELVCQTHTSLANILWAMERYPEALQQARLAEACATPALLVGVQQVLARCLESCDSLSQAEALYRSMNPGSDVQLAYIIESNLARLAVLRRDVEQALESLDETFDHAEDLYFRAMHEKDQYYQSLLQRERDNERLRYASALHRRTLLGIIVLVLILTLTGTYIIHTRTRMAAQRRIADAWRRKHEVDERIHQARLHRQDSILQQQQMEAQQEMLRQRDATIVFLQDFILQRCDVIRKLDSSSERHIVLSPHEWREVERTLDLIDGGRFAYLRECYPDLREGDIQLCILTRLRLSNRAIGNIYAISISAVKHRKLKLKKEIFGQFDPNLSLEQVLDEMAPET